MTYKQLNCEETKELIDNENLIIADVRDEDSFKEACIDGAIHLTVSFLSDFVNDNDKETPIIVYCYHGISSQSVAQHLVDQGFTQVYSLAGGFKSWQEHINQMSNEDER